MSRVRKISHLGIKFSTRKTNFILPSNREGNCFCKRLTLKHYFFHTLIMEGPVANYSLKSGLFFTNHYCFASKFSFYILLIDRSLFDLWLVNFLAVRLKQNLSHQKRGSIHCESSCGKKSNHT